MAPKPPMSLRKISGPNNIETIISKLNTKLPLMEIKDVYEPSAGWSFVFFISKRLFLLISVYSNRLQVNADWISGDS